MGQELNNVPASGQPPRERGPHVVTHENVARGSMLASLCSIGAVAAGIGAILGIITVIAASVSDDPEFADALPAGMAMIAFWCALGALVILALPFTVWVLSRDRKLLSARTRAPEQDEEILAARSRAWFFSGVSYAPALFFLGYLVITYGWHLIQGGDWNIWSLG
ncbi:hypothetical protein GWK18_09910 [Kocuria sp. JC486]|uniref:hypothetical protein n=1 Tax=Kocuria sp. JC486 TaxID=1970736 RepID=UPI001422F1AF|nr:hypothetical protein [Kocuria sp. JC486]NHU85893.1 hypothetical protein [Kocuria sp. JC486]